MIKIYTEFYLSLSDYVTMQRIGYTGILQTAYTPCEFAGRPFELEVKATD